MPAGMPPLHGNSCAVVLSPNIDSPATTPSPGLTCRDFGWLVTLLFAAGLVFHCAIYLTHAWATYSFPYQLDFGEGAVLCLAETLRRHEPIYRSLELPPFLAGLYVPLFPWLVSLTLGALPSFAGGRLLAELSTVLFALSLGGWLWRRTDARTALVGMAFYLANPVVLGWNCLDRIDSLGLLLSLWGLLLATRHSPDEPTPRFGVQDGVAALCFTLAFFDKQTFVAGPLSVFFAYLRLNRNLALRFAALQGGLLALGLAALHWASQGQFFTLLFRYNAMPFSSEQLCSYVYNYAVFALVLVILALQARLAPAVCKIYALASLWVVLGSGRFGADYNYFLELHGALALLAALGLHRLEGTHLKVGLGLALVQVFLIGVCLRLGPTFYCAQDYLLAEALPLWRGGEPKYMVAGRAAGDQLQAIIAQHPGPMICENMGHALLAGRIPWMCDPATFAGLVRRGLWDQELVLKPLRQGEVKVVVLQRLEFNPRFSDQFLQTVKEHYLYIGQFGVEHVFVSPPSPRDGGGT